MPRNSGIWLWCSSPRATGAVLVRDGWIAKAPPIWRSFIGLSLHVLVQDRGIDRIAIYEPHLLMSERASLSELMFATAVVRADEQRCAGGVSSTPYWRVCREVVARIVDRDAHQVLTGEARPLHL